MPKKNNPRRSAGLSELIDSTIETQIALVKAEVRRQVAGDLVGSRAAVGASAGPTRRRTPARAGRQTRHRMHRARLRQASKGPQFHYLCEHRSVAKSQISEWQAARRAAAAPKAKGAKVVARTPRAKA